MRHKLTLINAGLQGVVEAYHMTHARLFSFLLLAAICTAFLSVSNVNSQSTEMVTNSTIKTPPAGQCSVLALPFSAPVRSVLTGQFTADVPIDFYILSQGDFVAFTQAGNCELTASANPLFNAVYVTSMYNHYSSSPIPANGTYLFVFVYRNNGLTQITSGYGTVYLTFPSFVTFVTTETSSSTIIMTFSSTTPEFPDSNVSLVLVLSAVLAGVVLRRRKEFHR